MFSTPPATYTVEPGDTLSQIGERFNVPWPALAADNNVANPDLIFPGQVFSLTVHRGDGDGEATVRVAAPRVSAPRVLPEPTRWSGGSSYEQCVITRESGGNSQVVNASGHWGLYQFSASTWQAYGGSAASFGSASASEQHRVFSNAMARNGESNWSPYDGC